MRKGSIVTAMFGVILAVGLTGCPLFPQQNQQDQGDPETRPGPTRPAPIRQERTVPRTRPMRPAPTKRVPGISTIGPRELMTRINRIRTAVKANNWVKANQEANGMAGDMTRIKGDQGNKAGAREMTALNREYAKLQVNVKGKNTKQALNDLSRMEKIVNDMMK
jgi:hypothetical protein